MTSARILLTGATGFIGSHTWLALLAAGFEVVGIDDFSNSSPAVLERLHTLSGHAPDFHRTDVCDVGACTSRLGRRMVPARIVRATVRSVANGGEVASSGSDMGLSSSVQRSTTCATLSLMRSPVQCSQ